MPTARYLDQPYLLAGRRIDPITGTLSYREVQKHLRRKELEVLALLAEAGGEQVARSVFIEQVWQGNPIVGEQGLTDTISALRRSLLDTDRDNPLIQTIPRRGYQLRGSVRWISRDGGVAFVAGSVVEGRPDWRLKQLLEQTDAHESWLAEDGRSRRIFRFCRNEQQLRKLRREVVLMRYLREALAGRADVSTILDWQLEEPPYFLELAAPACGNLRGVMLGKIVPALPERWQLLQQVADALAAVHAAGVVHRNLSPDSILVDRRSGDRVALLGEFGLAALDDRQRLAELGIDAEGLSLKTGLLGPATAYTAPECVAGAPATAASDVYALGVLIAQTIRGDFQRLESAGFEDFPDGIAGLLRHCRAAEPKARPGAAEVATKLRELTEPKPTTRPASEPHDSPAPAITTLAIANVDTVAEQSALAAVTEPADDAPAPTSPSGLLHQRIGRYRIVSELAQGGMGVVYLAEQSEPVQRRVALKLIRAGLDSEQVLGRFEAERQALAMMSHPNISAIFDAGSTAGGYPYFVMEYVPGTDIKTYCDEAKLNLRARIRLFLQVCDGVLHAHQKGLIHRDLKPSNILVKQKSDQPGLVKLIDFGVAKSLTGGLGAGLQTQFGCFIGTPVYSCPEQVLHPTRDIDTRADLYSLGVVLYELLTGVPPRSVKDLDADTPAELARRLRDTKTPPMGSRFSGLSAEDRKRIADFRAMSEQGLSMDLGSDLDWIVGKCIAQDPEDRYATVQDLRLDLQRWLDDRPIEARPTSAWYRFRKMVRRNRLYSGLVGFSILIIAALTIITAALYQRNQKALIALREESHAAEQALSLLTSVFYSANPYQSGARPGTIREAIDAGVVEIEKRTDLPTKARQRLLKSIMDIYSGLGELDKAERIGVGLLRAEEINPEQRVSVLNVLGHIYRTNGNLGQAAAILKQAQDLMEQSIIDPRTAADVWITMHFLNFNMQDYSSAAQAAQTALALLESHPDSNPSIVLQVRLYHAMALSRLGKAAEAESIMASIFNEEKTEKLLGKPSIAQARQIYANVLLILGRYQEAVVQFELMMEAARQGLDEDHPDFLNFQFEMALGLEKTNAYEKAELLRAEILSKSIKIAGENSYYHLRGVYGLAFNLTLQHRSRDSLRLADQAHEMTRKHFPDQKDLLENIEIMQADARLRLGDHEAAIAWAERRLATSESGETSRQASVGQLDFMIGEGHLLEGNCSTATQRFSEARKKRAKADAHNPWKLDLLDAYLGLIRITGQPPEQRQNWIRSQTKLLESNVRWNRNESQEFKRVAEHVLQHGCKKSDSDSR